MYPVKIKSFGMPTVGKIMDDIFQNDLVRFSGADWQQTIPAVNIRETESGYELQMAAPGYQSTDFKISAEQGQLKISSERKNETETKGKISRREFSYESFERQFRLPQNAEHGSITARYENGILTVEIPVKQSEQNRVEIKVS
jgi:HSP20 family protein